MVLVAWTLFYLMAPAAILVLAKRVSFVARLGTIVAAYGVGLLVGNLGVLPEGIEAVHGLLTTLTVPLALPLLFFSMDVRQWRGLAANATKSLIAALIAVTIGSTLTFLAFRGVVGPEAWKAAGMLVGVYTGGTPNLAAIGNGLGITPALYVAVHGSDVVASAVVLLFLVGLAPHLYRRILPPFCDAGGREIQDAAFSPFFRGWGASEVRDMAKGGVLAAAVFAVGGSFTLFLPEAAALPAAILTITTLGVVLSFVPAVRNLRNTFQMGYYLILIFSITVSSMANVRDLGVSAPAVLAYVATLLVVSSLLHLILSALLRVDRDTHIITATSFIFSPPFVPVVAAALKNRRIVLPGIVIGVVGWVIGNYLGFALAYLFRSF